MSHMQELEKFEKLQKRFRMDSKWKSQGEKLRYYMSISPKKKLEWLRQIQEFISSVSPRNQKLFLRKLKVDR